MNIRTFLASAILACGSLSVANGAIIFSDNFDSYANTAAFTAVWPAVGALPSGTIVTDRSVSPSQSVHNVGTAAAASAERNERSFAESDTFSSDGAGGSNLPIGDKIIWSFDFYDSPANGAGGVITGSPNRNFANLQDTAAPASTNQLVSMGLNNNQTGGNSGGNYYMARILGYTVPTTADPDGGAAESVGGSGAYFKLNDFAAGLRTQGWHNLKAIISTDDGLSTDYDFYVDNVLAERVSNVGNAAAIRSYELIRIGSGVTNGNIDANFDNMQLEYVTVPEPATLLLVSALLPALLFARRRVA